MTHSRVPRWAMTLIAVLIVAFLLFPLYWMVNASLQAGSALLRTPPAWLPMESTLQGYRDALATQGSHLLTSLIVSLGTVALTLAVAAPAAYALAQLRLSGSLTIIFALLLAQMVPNIVMANSLYSIFNRLGLLDSYPGLILADSTTAVPFAILVLRAFMLSIPSELGEAARVDGAGHWRTFIRVIVPVSRNGLIAAGLFAFLFAWSDFLFALTMTTSDEIQPVTLSIYQFLGSHTSNWNSVMATAVFASIPAAILLAVAQRYVSAGLTGGAVKD
ncbi:MAG: ABC transporter permease subunit [Streptosporangiales bacterium]|nr:ABC transporter permease subunit [Streptosporangiales bacterium]